MSRSSLSIGDKPARVSYSEIPTEAAWKLDTGEAVFRVSDETMTLVDLSLANHEAAKGGYDPMVADTRYRTSAVWSTCTPCRAAGSGRRSGPDRPAP